MKGNNFVVEMALNPVPADVYQERGKAEADYTQQQMTAGKLTQLLVTSNHKRYWMLWCCEDRAELLQLLQGFPLHDYFDYSMHGVIDMVEAYKTG